MTCSCMPLNAIGIGKYAEVNNLDGGELMGKKLMEMGVNKGAILEIIRNDAGPLIIKVGETRLVLGRGMAQKVMVREV
ncbi:FeoA family protein [Clostridium frigidicarnis]|uniref:Ferrous iron transport protein A n=1 Tax=Clostridium frigidicarnis TaxID=84698 RepID=A0A1I0ZJJ9_9CLOT|nr:FeoA domain-containing protein [Clostridium frigidicarnis]SFB25691.1 ferrous iron transport protein A [Clostridium frigidicarnis]